MRIRITNGLVAAFDGDFRLSANACVDIADGVIVSVGAPSADAPPDCRIIDASGCLVMPGLTNAHCHSTEAWAKGRSEGTDLEAWFGTTFPNIDTLPDELIRIAGLLVAAEMLKSGVTTIVDHFRQIPATSRSVAAIAAAYREAGMNAGIAIMLRDRAIPKERDTAELRPLFAVAALEDVVREAIDACHRPADGIAVMLGPSAPHRCSDPLLQAIGAWSRQYGLRIHSHVDETIAQRKQAVDLYGCSTVRHLSDLGLLGPMLSLAHVTHVDGDDIGLLAQSGTYVVHNPVSNAKLGSGIAPLAELFQAGVPIALGTDGAASNDSQNQFEVLKLAALAQMLRHDRRAEPPKAADIVAMATRNGGGLLGTHHGVLAPGARADVIVLDLQAAPLVPLNDVHRQLVYGGSALSAKHVIARGRHVVDNGVITTFDETELYRRANASKRSIYP
jgi:cytosine/adenosine deaminase-related metal-dependent hydrolase